MGAGAGAGVGVGVDVDVGVDVGVDVDVGLGVGVGAGVGVGVGVGGRVGEGAMASVELLSSGISEESLSLFNSCTSAFNSAISLSEPLQPRKATARTIGNNFFKRIL